MFYCLNYKVVWVGFLCCPTENILDSKRKAVFDLKFYLEQANHNRKEELSKLQPYTAIVYTY